jgi:hypothetical protein
MTTGAIMLMHRQATKNVTTLCELTGLHVRPFKGLATYSKMY